MSIRSKLHQMQHERNRRKELTHQAELREVAKTLPAEIEVAQRIKTSSQRDLERMAIEQVGVTSEVTRENVRKACVAMSDLIRRQGCGTSRGQVLIHLPKEMLEVLRTRTSMGAFDFYWTLPEFQVVWKQLGFDEQRLVSFVNTAAVKLGKDILRDLGA